MREHARQTEHAHTRIWPDAGGDAGKKKAGAPGIFVTRSTDLVQLPVAA
jgi:hypothetical protein